MIQKRRENVSIYLDEKNAFRTSLVRSSCFLAFSLVSFRVRFLPASSRVEGFGREMERVRRGCFGSVVTGSESDDVGGFRNLANRSSQLSDKKRN